jgi:hypothetical protein
LQLPNLYLLADPLSEAPFRGAIRIENPPRLLRGELIPEEPIQVLRAMGGKLTDLIWTTWAGVFLISDRVREMLESAQVTGWATYPVVVFDANGAAVPSYHGFAVTGRCGLFDPERSQLVTKPPPTPRGRPALVRRGLCFDHSTWDGSDVFCSADEGSTIVVCADRARKLLAKHRVTNVRWQKLSDFEVLLKAL